MTLKLIHFKNKCFKNIAIICKAIAVDSRRFRHARSSRGGLLVQVCGELREQGQSHGVHREQRRSVCERSAPQPPVRLVRTQAQAFSQVTVSLQLGQLSGQSTGHQLHIRQALVPAQLMRTILLGQRISWQTVV